MKILFLILMPLLGISQTHRDTSYIVITEVDLVRTQVPGIIIHKTDEYGRSPEKVFVWKEDHYEYLDCVAVKYYIINDDKYYKQTIRIKQ